MQFFDLQTDFFRPAWRRIAVVAVCLGWALFEFISGAPFWGIIFGGMGVYALQQLFFSDWPKDPEPPVEVDAAVTVDTPDSPETASTTSTASAADRSSTSKSPSTPNMPETDDSR